MKGFTDIEKEILQNIINDEIQHYKKRADEYPTIQRFCGTQIKHLETILGKIL